MADAGEPGLEDRVLVAEGCVLRQVFPHPYDQIFDEIQRSVRKILGDAARPDVGVIHPQTRDQLERVQHLLPLAESDGHHGKCADLHAAGGDAHQMRGDAIQLHHQHPNDVGLLWDLRLDVEQPLHTQAVGRLLVQRREVVHPGTEGDPLSPATELHVLFDAGVQVADAATGLGDRFALQFQDQPQYAVCGRMLGTHVDHDSLVATLGLLGDDGVPILSGDGVDVALSRVGRGTIGIFF